MIRGCVRLSLGLFIGLVLASACGGSDDFEAPGGTSGTGGSGGSDAGDSGGGSAGSESDASNDSAGTKDNGEDCTSQAECISSSCVDGVCCDTACDGACESCALTDKKGTCSPQAAGQDPDGDCSAFESCEAACDGKGACLSCGAFQCDSAGSSCLDSCSAETDCKDTAWCNAGVCENKKNNGIACVDAKECTSGVCALGFCCNVACAAPASCTTGTCDCGGAQCAAGDACKTFYADVDKDTFGDPSATKLACTSTPPSGYVENKTDCYDNNPSAHPGQTAFFTVSRGDGSYDYDCSGTTTQQYPNLGSASCASCGGCIGGCFVAFGCGGTTCPAGLPKSGFASDVACGVSATLSTCIDTNSTSVCTPSVTSTPSTAQACH